MRNFQAYAITLRNGGLSMDLIPAQHEEKDHKIKHDPTQSLLETPSPTLWTGPPSAHLSLRCDGTHLNTTSCKATKQLYVQPGCKLKERKGSGKRKISVMAQRKGGIKVSPVQQSYKWLQRCCVESEAISLPSFCTHVFCIWTTHQSR